MLLLNYAEVAGLRARFPYMPGARFLLLLAILLSAGVAQAAEIYVDGVACQLSDAITAANTDQAIFGCAAGSGADTLILTRDIKLQLGNLPGITSDITLEYNLAAALSTSCGDSPPSDPNDNPPTDDPPDDPPKNGPPGEDDPPSDPPTDPPDDPDDPNDPPPGEDDPPSDPPTNNPPPGNTPPDPPTNNPPPGNTPPDPPDPNNPSDNPPGSTWGFNRPDIPSHCLHIVTQNQTLFRIALAHNFSVREISSLNGLVSDDRLLVGQALIIPYEDCVQYAPLKG